jgi:hypothetical protein
MVIQLLLAGHEAHERKVLRNPGERGDAPREENP